MPELSPDDRLLVTRFFEEDLSSEERALLVSKLEGSPALRTAYLEEAALISLLQELPEETLDQAKPQRHHKKTWLPAIGIAAAAGIALALFFPKSTPAPSSQQASIRASHGALLINGKAANQNSIVTSGQTVQLNGEHSSANLTFSDGSQLLLTGDSKLTLLDKGRRGVEMESGVVHASMSDHRTDSPFLVVTPTSRLEAPGSRFALEMASDKTRFVVSEGKVKLKDLAQSKVQTFATGVEVERKGAGRFEVSSSQRSQFSWQYDFEEPSPEDYLGTPITSDLPAGSRGGALATASFVEGMGRYFYQIGFRDYLTGLCQITDDSHLEMTFRTRQPYWFNTFIHAIDLREGETLDVKIYKLAPAQLRNKGYVRDLWNQATIPLSAFREQGDGSFNGPPPEAGLLITTLYVSSPEPERDLRLDDIAILPSGEGRIVLEPLTP
ncbi:FecR family protein [Roseibacillus persicicus]|uniref:FecR protein domain-containing protein n=1 Tax=Roseibacillus persicicus TaxID=454148 RepID=A0A918WH05_9BACT|nr:FecR family protein [Roseibacillus persicicus]GHC45801.1 hypothetical protein GCM10007100_09050 [Roseibacillus persicicus]